MAIKYVGNDCSDSRDKVEDFANHICEKNVPMNQLKLGEEDAAEMKSFDCVKSTGEAGGVMIKKFTVNSAKEQLILEYNVGASKRKEAGPESNSIPVAKSAAKDPSVSKGGTGKSASGSASQKLCYDSVPQVTEQLVEEIIGLLKAEGVSMDAREAILRSKLADRLETPLTLLKNTAYTRGFKSHIGEPIANFVVKR